MKDDRTWGELVKELDAKIAAKAWPQPMPRPARGAAPQALLGALKPDRRELGRFLDDARKAARARRERLGWLLESFDDVARYHDQHADDPE